MSGHAVEAWRSSGPGVAVASSFARTLMRTLSQASPSMQVVAAAALR